MRANIKKKKKKKKNWDSNSRTKKWNFRIFLDLKPALFQMKREKSVPSSSDRVDGSTIASILYHHIRGCLEAVHHISKLNWPLNKYCIHLILIYNICNCAISFCCVLTSNKQVTLKSRTFVLVYNTSAVHFFGIVCMEQF